MSDQFVLADAAYGKSQVRLVKIERGPERHDVRDITVAIRLEGDFDAAYLAGDNSRVLPTDTMKNTVYSLAAGASLGAIELFGTRLATHFLEASPGAAAVRIDLAERAWRRITVADHPHPTAFLQAGGERRLARIEATRADQTIDAGLDGLFVMKTAKSAFAGFPRDRFTTLPDTSDRIFATIVHAMWRYRQDYFDFDMAATHVRRVLLERFAEHESQSVQHTLHAMGEAVLAAHPAVEHITISMPNKHHLPVDLLPFGLANNNEIFVATDEPFGLIEATVRRKTPEAGGESKRQEIGGERREARVKGKGREAGGESGA